MEIPCTSCGTPLTSHCTSKGCKWMRCENRLCIWQVYDLESGIRSTANGNVEHMPTDEPMPDGA